MIELIKKRAEECTSVDNSSALTLQEIVEETGLTEQECLCSLQKLSNEGLIKKTLKLDKNKKQRIAYLEVEAKKVSKEEVKK